MRHRSDPTSEPRKSNQPDRSRSWISACETLQRRYNKSVKRETALSIQNGHRADDIPITRLSAPHLVMTRKE